MHLASCLELSIMTYMIPTYFGLDVVDNGPTVGTFTCVLMHPEFEHGKLFLDTFAMSIVHVHLLQ
jgi:hypothetical protein